MEPKILYGKEKHRQIKKPLREKQKVLHGFENGIFLRKRKHKEKNIL